MSTFGAKKYSLFSLKRGWNLWKKIAGEYPAILSEKGSSIKDLLYFQQKNGFLWDQWGQFPATRQALVTRLETQSELGICFILPICGFNHTVMDFIMSDLKGCFGNLVMDKCPLERLTDCFSAGSSWCENYSKLRPC